MKRNIILFSVLATLVISACGGKKTAEDNKQAKLDALKKEIAKLQSEASALEKEIDSTGCKCYGRSSISSARQYNHFSRSQRIATANDLRHHPI